MRITRSTNSSIQPRAYETLAFRRDANYFHQQRTLRHPLGIYGRSLNDIWEGFESVLDELERILVSKPFREIPPVIGWDIELTLRQEKLMRDLMRHFDDCRNLILCLYEQDWKQVQKIPIVANALQLTQPYRDHIATIENHIKHCQGSLRGLALFNDTIAIPGYFVEHVDTTGAIGTHPDVHPTYQGMHTAFSFFRDLRFNFWLVFAVSEIIADVVWQVQPQPTNSEVDTTSDALLLQLATRIASLPKWMFKDEATKPFPEIRADNSFVILEYPSNNTELPSLSGTYSVALSFRGDGVSTIFQLPYYSG